MANPDLQPDSTDPTVVVIDDAVDVHRLLNARLRGEGIKLCFANDGNEGLELVQRSDPWVVLLDLNMPGLDGFEVLRQLKQDPATDRIPVIVLSGLEGTDDKVTAFDLGAHDYVTKPFDPVELRIRLRVGLQVAKLIRMLEQRAQIDGLTGLWNRAYFDRRWSEETSANLRHGRPLSVALIDADRFKSINDTYGHPAGDAVLVALAGLMKSEARAADVACRYGGEEFALIMPDTGPQDARMVCERIRGAIETVDFPRHPERRVSVSIGIAGSSGTLALDPNAWVEQADACLYRAKNEGRNRVIVTPLADDQGGFAKAG